MQSTADGAHRKVENLGDCFIAATIDFPQHEHFTMLIAEDREGLANLPATFLSFEVFQRSVFRIDRFLAAVVSCLVDRKDGAATPTLGRSHVECNPVKPGVKGTSSVKRLQLDESLDKRVLDDVEGIVGRSDDVDQRIEQAVLIFLDQLPKGGRIAGQSLSNQSGVVVHRFEKLDARW